MIATIDLQHPDKNVRIQQALTVGERRDIDALEDLVQGLRDDPDFFVRETMTWALMRLGDLAVDPLIELTRNPAARVRHDAIHALSKIGYALAGADRDGRTRTADVLASIDDPRSVEALIAGLGDEAWEVRASVLMALSGFRGERACAAIAAIAATPHDPDHRVRALADRLAQDS